jgi:hypothetical protein
MFLRSARGDTGMVPYLSGDEDVGGLHVPVDDLVVVDEEETLEHLLHHLLDIACAHKDRLTDCCSPDPAKLRIRLGPWIRFKSGSRQA